MFKLKYRICFYLFTGRRAAPDRRRVLQRPQGSNHGGIPRTQGKRLMIRPRDQNPIPLPPFQSVYAALPIGCYREIASTLPDTPAKLKEVDQMTESRVEKYGHIIFKVCQPRSPNIRNLATYHWSKI